MKLCECGCGQTTKIATRSYSCYGIVKGAPLRFIKHHFQPLAKGEDHYNWHGGKHTGTRGYKFITCHGHPRADRSGYVLEHVIVAEKALGRFLPESVKVHHVNERTHDNSNRNLVICQDQAYHLLLHVRARAVMAGFPADWLKCKGCKLFDDPKNLYIHPSGRGNMHRACKSKYRRAYKERTGR